MRKMSLKTDNVELNVNTWNVSLGYEDLNTIIREHIGEGTHHVKLTLTIEELPNKGIFIESNKPEEQQEELENEEN